MPSSLPKGSAPAAARDVTTRLFSGAGCWRRGRRGRRRLDHGRGERRAERGAALGRDVVAAGVLGEAGDLLPLLARQAEADDMGGEIDAGLFEFRRDRAGIGVAGLEAVGDQDDGGLVLGVAKVLRGLLHRLADRRLALGREGVGRLGDQVGGAGARRHDQLDVGAAALVAVAVGHEAEFEIAGHRPEHVGERFAGDRDLRLAADLAPHRARGVEDDDRLVGMGGGGGREQGRTGETSENAIH